MRISNSRLDCWESCAKKYEYRYIDNLKGDFTPAALLFGSAIDKALNYILESMLKKEEWTRTQAVVIFRDYMETYEGQNRLDYFKGEAPPDLELDPEDPLSWQLVHDEMRTRGLRMIDTYIDDVLPQFEEVLSVQNEVIIPNGDGDEFIFILDFIVKMKDGRTVLMDNKTASKRYPKNKVVKSQQLSLYLDQFPEIKYAGYVVLIKNPEKERGITYQILIDEIPEETTAESYERLDAALQGIKSGEFPCNPKNCYQYGKRCEYFLKCTTNEDPSLIPNREIK